MQTIHLRYHIANVLRSQGEYGKAFAEATASTAPSPRAALGAKHRAPGWAAGRQHGSRLGGLWPVPAGA